MKPTCIQWQGAGQVRVGKFAPGELGYRIGDAVVHMPRWGANHPSVFRMDVPGVPPAHSAPTQAALFAQHGPVTTHRSVQTHRAAMQCMSDDGGEMSFEVSFPVMNTLTNAPWGQMFDSGLGVVNRLFPAEHIFLPALQRIWRGERMNLDFYDPPAAVARYLRSDGFLQGGARFRFVRDVLVKQFAPAFSRVLPDEAAAQLGESLALSSLARYWLVPAGFRIYVDSTTNETKHLVQQVVARLMMSVVMASSRQVPAAWQQHASMQQPAAGAQITRLIADYGLDIESLATPQSFPLNANVHMLQPLLHIQGFRFAAILARQIGESTEHVIDDQFMLFRTMLFADFCEAVMNWGHGAARESLQWMEAQYRLLPPAVQGDQRAGLMGYGYVHGLLSDVRGRLDPDDVAGKMALDQVLAILEDFPNIARRERIYGQALLWYRGEIEEFRNTIQSGDRGRALSNVGRIFDYIEGGTTHAELERLAALGRVWHMETHDEARQLGVVNRPGSAVPELSDALVEQYAQWAAWHDFMRSGSLDYDERVRSALSGGSWPEARDTLRALAHFRDNDLAAALTPYPNLTVQSPDDAFALYAMRWMVGLAEAVIPS